MYVDEAHKAEHTPQGINVDSLLVEKEEGEESELLNHQTYWNLWEI